MKRCSSCHKLKQKNEFYRQSPGCKTKTKDGLHAYCKKCFLKKQLAYSRTPEGKYVEMKKDAKRRGKKFTISLDDVKKMWKMPCAYCGRQVKLVSLDRVDNGKHYTPENVVVCCKWCNYTKGTGSAAFFSDQCKRVVENMSSRLKRTGKLSDIGSRYQGTIS